MRIKKKLKKIAFLLLIGIILIGGLLFFLWKDKLKLSLTDTEQQDIPSIFSYTGTSFQTSYTSNSITTCNNGMCQVQISPNPNEYVYEEGQWKNYRNAKSLKGKGYEVKYLKLDNGLKLEVLDFNSTNMKVNITVNSSYINKPITFGIVDKNGSWIRNITIKIINPSLNGLTFNYPVNLWNRIKLGDTSTIVTITSINQDGFVYYHTEIEEYARYTEDEWIPVKSEESYIYRGYYEFNTNSIPDGATITDTKVNLTARLVSIEGTTNIRDITSKPTTASDENLWKDIGNGTIYLTPTFTTGDEYVEKTYDLGSIADIDLQNLLGSDWFAIGLQNVTFNGDIVSSETLQEEWLPKLIVTYTIDKPPYFINITANQTYALAGQKINFSAIAKDDETVVNTAWFRHNFDLGIIQNQSSYQRYTANDLGNLSYVAQAFAFPYEGQPTITIHQICQNMKLGSYTYYQDNITLEIREAISNIPTATILGRQILTNESMTTSYDWKCVNFTNPVTISTGVQYAVVWNASTSRTSAYSLGRSSLSNAKLTTGQYSYSNNGGVSWTTSSNGDIAVNIFGASGGWKNESLINVNSAEKMVSQIITTSTASSTPFNYYWCGNDSLNQLGCSAKQDYWVLSTSPIDTIMPQGSINVPPNNSYVSSNLTLDGEVTDNVGVAYVTYQYKNTTVDWTNMTGCEKITSSSYDCIWNTNLFADTTGYNIRIVPCDLAGNCNTTTTTKYYIIDQTIPIYQFLNVSYPTYSSSIQTHKQTSVRNSQRVVLFLNTTDVAGAGINMSRVVLTDLNETGEVNMLFQSGSKSTGQWSMWNITVNISSTTGAKFVPVKVYDNSTPNNIMTSAFIVRVDLANPTFDNNTLSHFGIELSEPFYNNSNISFQVKISDNYQLSHFVFANNFTGSWTNHTKNFTGIINYTGASEEWAINISRLKTGGYKYYFGFWDDAGNYNQTQQGSITILEQVPAFINISLISPGSEANFTTSNVTFVYNYTGGTSQTCNLMIDDITNLTAIDPTINTTLYFYQNFSDGYYSWGIRCNNSFGTDYYSEETRNFNISTEAPPEDTTPPIIAFIEKIPLDISTDNLYEAGLNITYNITDETSVNLSSVRLWYKTNSTELDGSIFVNGSLREGFNFKDVFDNVDINYTWNLIEDTVYPGIYNINASRMREAEHNVQAVGKDEFMKIRFFNVSSNRSYNTFEIMANSSLEKLAKIFYCNSSYTTGNPNINANCHLFYFLSPQMGFNHTHTENSSHRIIPLAIVNGLVNGVNVTETSYIVFGGEAGWSVYYIDDIAREDSYQLSVDKGTSYSNFAGTVDAHLHQFNGNAFWHFAEACDTLGNCDNSTVSKDLIALGGIPPTSPMVYNPVEGTYSGFITINHTASFSPLGYDISFYNISLVNTGNTFNRTIRTNNSLNLSYVWDSLEAVNGEYLIRVEACDVTSQCSSGYSDNFTIDNIPSDTEYPLFSNFLTHIANNSQYTPINYQINTTIISTNGTAGIQFNNINYSLSNISSSFYKTFGQIQVGTYSYYFWAYGNGTNKNYNKTEMKSYVILINSSLELGLSVSSPITYGTSTNFVGSNCPSQLTCSLNISNGIFAVGTLWANYSTSGNINYTGASVVNSTVINQIAPTLTPYINHTNNDFITYNTSSAGVDNIYLNYTLTGVCQGTGKVFLNGSIINSGTFNLSNQTNLLSGYYNVTYVFDLNTNCSGKIDTLWVNITETEVPPPDTTPPTWISLNNKTCYANYSCSHSITATDASGIDGYFLNDTSVFSITRNTGAIINITELIDIKIYYLNASVNDTLGNKAYGEFWINVTEYIPPIIRPCSNKTVNYNNPFLPKVYVRGCYPFT